MSDIAEIIERAALRNHVPVEARVLHRMPTLTVAPFRVPRRRRSDAAALGAAAACALIVTCACALTLTAFAIPEMPFPHAAQLLAISLFRVQSVPQSLLVVMALLVLVPAAMVGIGVRRRATNLTLFGVGFAIGMLAIAALASGLTWHSVSARSAMRHSSMTQASIELPTATSAADTQPPAQPLRGGRRFSGLITAAN